MTNLSAYLTFFYFYFFYYAAPCIVLSAIANLLGLNIEQFIKSIGDFKLLLGVISVLVLFILPIYRTKIAVAAYGDGDIKFWEAHSVSGVILRANLAFLPIIGVLFKVKDK